MTEKTAAPKLRKYKWTCMICGAIDIAEHPPVWCSTCKAPPSQRKQDPIKTVDDMNQGQVTPTSVVNDPRKDLT